MPGAGLGRREPRAELAQLPQADGLALVGRHADVVLVSSVRDAGKHHPPCVETYAPDLVCLDLEDVHEPEHVASANRNLGGVGRSVGVLVSRAIGVVREDVPQKGELAPAGKPAPDDRRRGLLLATELEACVQAKRGFYGPCAGALQRPRNRQECVPALSVCQLFQRTSAIW